MGQNGFTRLIDDSNAFFAGLKQNNTKDWFAPRKDHYNTNIKKPAEFLGDVLAEDFSRISGQVYQPKLFRIYRDVRFSKDKTPFNAHLHMIWRQPGDSPFAPAFFFGSEPGEMTVGFGVMGLKGESLARFRAFIDTWGDEVQEAIEESGMTWSDWGGPPLKRVPPPYDKDHPHGDLLKRKSMVISTQMTSDWRSAKGGLVKAISTHFQNTRALANLMKNHLSAGGS